MGTLVGMLLDMLLCMLLDKVLLFVKLLYDVLVGMLPPILLVEGAGAGLVVLDPGLMYMGHAVGPWSALTGGHWKLFPTRI